MNVQLLDGFVKDEHVASRDNVTGSRTITVTDSELLCIRAVQRHLLVIFGVFAALCMSLLNSLSNWEEEAIGVSWRPRSTKSTKCQHAYF